MRQKGFTLIELIIVIVVMGVACAGLAAAISASIINTHKPEVLSTATALAEKEAERVIRLAFSSVADENRGAPQSYTGAFSNYSREVRVDSIDTSQPNLGSDPTMANYKIVEVRVHHGAINYVAIKFLKSNHL